MALDRALSAAADAEDWAAVSEIVTSRWGELMEEHREVFARVTMAVPAEALEAFPSLALARAAMTMSPQAGALGLTNYGAAQQPTGLRNVLVHLTASGVRARMEGEHEHAVAKAGEGHAILSEASDSARRSMAVIVPDLEVQWGLNRFLAGEVESALESFTDAYENAAATGNTRMMVDAAGNNALILALIGSTIDAQAWLDRIPSYDNPRDTVGDAGMIASASLAIDRADEPASWKLVTGFAGTPESEHWTIRMFVAARRAAMWDGDTTVALTGFHGLSRSRRLGGRETGLNGVLLAHTEAVLRLRATDVVRAREALERVQDVPVAWQNAHAVMEARVEMAAGRPQRAVGLVNTVIGRDPSPRDALSARLLRAVLLTSEDDRDAAVWLMETFGLHALATILPRHQWDEWGRGSGELPPTALFERPWPDGHVRLTRREKDVLRAVVAGRTIADVAAEQHLSPHTIKKQLLSAYRRIGVDNRADAIEQVHLRPWLIGDGG